MDGKITRPLRHNGIPYQRINVMVWIDRVSGGLEDTGCRVTPVDAQGIVRLVAHHVGVEVHAGSPRVSAELPESGERFKGLVPPGVAAPCFAICLPAVAVFTLRDYVEAGIMSGAQAELLQAAARERKNKLVTGGTSTGETTLVNALLAEVDKTGDRVVVIEDTRELQCAAPNLVAFRTKDGAASLSDLVRSSVRLLCERYNDAGCCACYVIAIARERGSLHDVILLSL
jgi:type IV secretion system protein TrbB